MRHAPAICARWLAIPIGFALAACAPAAIAAPRAAAPVELAAGDARGASSADFAADVAHAPSREPSGLLDEPLRRASARHFAPAKRAASSPAVLAAPRGDDPPALEARARAVVHDDRPRAFPARTGAGIRAPPGAAR